MQLMTIETEGGAFTGYRWDAPARGPAIVLLQEIFGVNANIRGLAEQFATKGFTVLAPDMFWRLQPGTDLSYSEEDRQIAFDLYGRFDFDAGVEDVGAAVAAIRRHPSCDGRVAIIGYCLGGLLAYRTAARFDPQLAVAYYGGGIERHLDEMDEVSCPLLLHYGAVDGHIPPAAVEAVRVAATGRKNIRVEVYPDAGHAFANKSRPTMYNGLASGRADALTETYLDAMRIGRDGIRGRPLA
jgi:carboxymethylenebutenolidase